MSFRLVEQGLISIKWIGSNLYLKKGPKKQRPNKKVRNGNLP